MGILWPQDVRTKIVTQLNDGTNGIVAQLTAIDTTRGTVTDPPKYIDPVSNDGNFPSVYVDLGDSTILTPHGTTYALARETLELQVSVIMKHSKNDILRQSLENYFEAIMRCLQNFDYQASDGAFFMVANKVSRADLDIQVKETTKGLAVIFEVHRNEF